MGIHHPTGWTLERNAGRTDWIFIHFIDPVRLLTPIGKVTVEGGTSVLHAPDFPQWYQALPGGFRHDWLHFRGTAAARLLADRGIQPNSPFRTAHGEHLGSILGMMADELLTCRQSWHRAIWLHFQTMALWLKRGRRSEAPLSRIGEGPKVRLEALRRDLGAYPEKEWTLAAMAERVCLSRSRFSVLYREFFQSSPATDLIQWRVQKACWLLTHENLSIKQVAPACGFRDESYLCRVFKRLLGESPAKYARSRRVYQSAMKS